jgi:hypothetical protein
MLRATPGTGPISADELGSARRVVGDLVERDQRRLRHHRRGTRMALRPNQLGQRLIRDLAHDVAAEPPPILPSSSSQPVVSQGLDVGIVELLLHLVGELRERFDRARRAEHGGVVDDRARCVGNRSRRAAISARNEPGSAVLVGFVLRQLGELDEEQRIPAAAFVQLVDEPISRHRHRARR